MFSYVFLVFLKYFSVVFSESFFLFRSFVKAFVFKFVSINSSIHLTLYPSNYPFINALIYMIIHTSTIHAPTHISTIYACIQPFTHLSLIYPFIHPFIPFVIYLFNNSFINLYHPFIHHFIYPPLHPSILLSIDSFTHACTYPFIQTHQQILGALKRIGMEEGIWLTDSSSLYILSAQLLDVSAK